MKEWWTKNYEYMKSLGMESVSGTGSTLDATKTIREELPKLIKKYGIKSMLDIPCGDGHWMNQIDFGDMGYWGADIVAENIHHNIESNKSRHNATWSVLDITANELPMVDLVFCRDCLVHFSTSDIKAALLHIYLSGSTYLLTTSFIDRDTNYDIETGGWQTLNLLREPFNFPQPLEIVYEHCPEQDGRFSDKALCLWNIDDLRLKP